MSTFNRRSFLGLAAGGVALAATGCTPGGGASPQPTAAGTPGAGASGSLKVGWYGGAPVHAAMDKVLKGFTAANPAIATSGTGVAFADYWDKLATETAGGSGPDVFRMSMTYFTEYASRGALRDLTADAASTIDASTLDADVRDSGLVGGKLMGIGQSSIAPALFSHGGMLQAAGASVPDEWTWADFQTWVTDFAKNAGPDKWGTTDLGGNFQMFDVFARQEVGNQFDPEGKLLLDQAVVEAWYAMWDGLRRGKAAPPQDVTAAGGTFETNPMSKGQAALTAGWVQQVTFFQPLIADGTVAVSPLPQKVKGDLSGLFVKALDFWCVSATTKAPEAAAALVDHLINDSAATKEIGLLLGVPPTGSARDQLSSAGGATTAAIDYVEKVTPKAGKAPGPWPKGYGECLSAFGRANESVGFGQATPAQAAQTFLSEAKAALGA